MNLLRKTLFAGLSLGLAFAPACPLHACAMCYGKTDSPLAAGMNWGIMSLLVVVVMVLGSIASFFVFLARRAAGIARTAVAEGSSNPMEANQKT